MTSVQPNLVCICEGSQSCRYDLVLELFSPGYRLPDHTGTAKPANTVDDDPLILTLARYYRKTPAAPGALPRLSRSPWDIPRLSRSPPMTITSSGIPRVGRGPVGLPLEPGKNGSKEFDLADTQARHNPMIPHTLVLKPGLHVIPQRLNGCGSGAGLLSIDLWHDLRRAATMRSKSRLGSEDSGSPRGLERGQPVSFLPWMEPGSKRS